MGYHKYKTCPTPSECSQEIFKKCIAVLDYDERVLFKMLIHKGEEVRRFTTLRLFKQSAFQGRPYWFNGPQCGWQRRVLSHAEALFMSDAAVGGATAYGDLAFYDGKVLGRDIAGNEMSVLPAEAVPDVEIWDAGRTGVDKKLPVAREMMRVLREEQRLDRARPLTMRSGADGMAEGGAAPVERGFATGSWVVQARPRGGAWESVNPPNVAAGPNASAAVAFLKKWLSGRVGGGAGLETRIVNEAAPER